MKLRTPYLICFLLFVTLGVYYPSLFAPISTVDDPRMFSSLINTSHFSLKGLFLPGGSGYYYRPLLVATFVADKYLWGAHESFMHLENILLHGANVVLVFFVAREVARIRSAEATIPLVAALLFALHPINTESVNWISGRTDVLAGLFVLSSLCLLLNALRTGSSIGAAVSAGLFFVGCFAKETAVFFSPAAILIIFCYDWGSVLRPASLARSITGRRWYYATHVMAVLAYFCVRHFALAGGDGGVAHAAKGVIGRDANHLYTLRVIVKASGFYAKKLFYPWPLNFGIVKVPNYYIPVGILVIVVVLWLLVRPGIISALFISTFAVGSSAFLVAISRMAWTPIAERYMYIPCAFFSVAVTFVVATYCRRWRVERVAAFFVPLLFTGVASATVSRNIVWQDNLTLFQDTVKKSPDFHTAKNDLAAALLARGRKDEAFNVLKTLESTSEHTSYNDLTILSTAVVMVNEDRLLEARKLLRDNLRDDSKLYEDFVQRLLNIDGIRLEKSKDKNEKREIRREIIELLIRLQEHTHDPFQYYRIGQQYLFIGNKKEAQKYFARAYAAAPEDSHYKQAAGKLAEKLKQ